LEPLLGYAGLAEMPAISVIGGSAKNDLLVRIKASVMKTTLRLLDVEEATAFGAAILGGLGAGIFRDVGHALGTVRMRSELVDPDPTAAASYDAYFCDVYQHLYEALRSSNHLIHRLSVGDAPGPNV
jgi:xylulokinase